MIPETKFEQFHRSLLAIVLVLVASPVLLARGACSGAAKAWRRIWNQ
jgi:hypothetical protein